MGLCTPLKRQGEETRKSRSAGVGVYMTEIEMEITYIYMRIHLQKKRGGRESSKRGMKLGQKNVR